MSEMYDDFKTSVMGVLNNSSATSIAKATALATLVGYENIEKIEEVKDEGTEIVSHGGVSIFIGESIIFLKPDSRIAVPLDGTIHEAVIAALWAEKNQKNGDTTAFDTISSLLDESMTSDTELVAFLTAVIHGDDVAEYYEETRKGLNQYIQHKVANCFREAMAKTNALEIVLQYPTNNVTEEKNSTPKEKSPMHERVANLVITSGMFEDTTSSIDKGAYTTVQRNSSNRSWVCRIYGGERKTSVLFNDEKQTKIDFKELTPEISEQIRNALREVCLN